MSVKRRTLVYVRQSVSRAEQDDSVSLAFQERRIRDYCDRNDMDVVGVYSDIDVSGNVESRSGLDAMLARCQQGDVRVVAIYNISRLARDTYLFLKITRELATRKIELVSASESMEDKTVTVVLSAFAERERTTLSNNVAFSIREQARRGLVTQQVPYGYRRESGVLFPVEPEASIVRRIFREFVDGHSTPEIADALMKDGILSPAGQPNWRARTVRRMLERRTYNGEIEISESRDPAGRVRPHLVTRGQHEPLIDPDTWEQAQRLLAGTRWTRTKEIANPWLSGAMECRDCGRPLYVGIKSRTSTVSRVRWYAKCATAQLASDARIASTCPASQKSASLELIEPMARLALAERLRGIVTAEEAYNAARATTVRRGGDRRTELTARLDEDTRQSAELVSLRLRRLITDDEFAQHRERLDQSIERITAELETIPVEVPLIQFVRARAQIASVAGNVLTMDDDGLRALVSRLGARASVDLATKQVTWRFGEPFAELLPG